MRIKVTFAALFVVLLAALLAGCGGGQSEDQSGEQPKSQPAKKQSEKAIGQKTARPVQQRTPLKTALGTISNVKPEKERLYLRPTKGGKAMGFRVTNEPKITMNGVKAELSDLQKGQQAMIRYRTGKNLDRARIIQVFGRGGSGAKGGKEKTGG